MHEIAVAKDVPSLAKREMFLKEHQGFVAPYLASLTVKTPEFEQLYDTNGRHGAEAISMALHNYIIGVQEILNDVR